VSLLVAALVGVAAGLMHVVAGPDHLAALAPLSTTRERAAWRTGLLWGLGHTAGVLVIGLLLIALRDVLPIAAVSAHSERLVGVALLLVGVWGVRRAWRFHRHRNDHSHAPVGASFAMGALHGVAGSSHLFGVLPALALPTQAAALVYLAGFGVGAVVAMTTFSSLIGLVTVAAGRRGPQTHQSLLYLCSFSAVIVGSFWLVA
jgi:hypothetical protein